MPRAVWKGQIAFGLVNVPVELFSTTQDKSVHFHMLTKDGGCRLRQKLYCPATKKEYDFGDTAKGIEISPENYVILDKAELQALRPESGHSIDIIDFIALDEVDPVYFNRSYYLAPSERSGKAYHLLHQSMKRAGKVALARFVMRQKEYLALIRPLASALCLETMHYQEEIVAVDDVPHLGKKAGGGKLSTKELQIADQLIASMTTSFDPRKYHDEYSRQVKKLVGDKAKGKKIVARDTAPKTAKVIDLMEALKQSVAKKQKAPKAAATRARAKRHAKAN